MSLFAFANSIASRRSLAESTVTAEYSEVIVRGVKKTTSPLLKGNQIYHNYVRSHMALDGGTPAEKAGIEVKGQDKWLTLIQNASTKMKERQYPRLTR